MSFLDDISEPPEGEPRDVVTEALQLVARMTPAELAAFRVHMQFPVRLVGAERPATLAATHDPGVFAADP